MTTYNTNNPVPSADPRDRFDNSQVFDEMVTGQQPSVLDRRGNERMTIYGAEQAWQQLMQNSGFETTHLVYVDGAPLVVSRASQLIDRGGSSYRVKAPYPAFPLTLTGTWATDQSLLAEVTDAALRQDLADPTKGADIVAWRRSALSSAVSTAGQMLSTTAINVWEYANLAVKPNPADPSTWDWTPAFAAIAALNTASGPAPDKKGIAVLLPFGTYRLSSVAWPPRTEFYSAGGVIMPFSPTATATHLMFFSAHSRVTNLTVDMDYALNYGAALWVRGRHVQMSGCVVWKARTAWMFGDPSWATTPASGMLGDSENILSHCETVWCLTAVKAYGLNTIITLNSCLLYTYKESLPAGDPRKAAWEALPAMTFQNWGALIYITGGAIANFSGEAPLMRSELQPVSGDPAYKNSFGRYFVSGTHIETGFLFECGSVGSYTAEDTTTRTLKVEGCNGYVSSSAGNFIAVGADCQQSVHVSGCNFYGQIQNNLIYALAAKCYIEPASFRNISVDFFQAFHARRVEGYDRFCALVARSTSQAYTSAFSALKMPTADLSDVWSSFQPEWYNASSGIFTAQTSMRNVTVDVSLSLASGAATDVTDIRLLLAGVEFYTTTRTGPAPNACFTLPRVAIGQTIEVRIAQYQSRSSNGSAGNRVTITGAT